MTATQQLTSDLDVMLKAIASERRLQILDWLKDPAVHLSLIHI